MHRQVGEPIVRSHALGVLGGELWPVPRDGSRRGTMSSASLGNRSSPQLYLPRCPWLRLFRDIEWERYNVDVNLGCLSETLAEIVSPRAEALSLSGHLLGNHSRSPRTAS